MQQIKKGLIPGFVAFILLITSPLSASSNLPVVQQGGFDSTKISINYSGNRLDVNALTNDPFSTINWQSFNITQGFEVHFNQTTNQTLINKVTGSGVSSIAGLISGNGFVVISNPYGIINTGVVNLQASLLTSHTIRNVYHDAQLGKVFLEMGREGNLAKVINRGHINSGAYEAQQIALVANAIENEGEIIANARIDLLSADNVAIAYGDSGVHIEVHEELRTPRQGELETNSAIRNTGKIKVKNGKINLTVHDAHEIFSYAVNQEGIIEASSLGDLGANIEIAADNAVIFSGTSQLRILDDSQNSEVRIDAKSLVIEEGAEVSLENAKFKVNTQDNFTINTTIATNNTALDAIDLRSQQGAYTNLLNTGIAPTVSSKLLAPQGGIILNVNGGLKVLAGDYDRQSRGNRIFARDYDITNRGTGSMNMFFDEHGMENIRSISVKNYAYSNEDNYIFIDTGLHPTLNLTRDSRILTNARNTNIETVNMQSSLSLGNLDNNGDLHSFHVDTFGLNTELFFLNDADVHIRLLWREYANSRDWLGRDTGSHYFWFFPEVSLIYVNEFKKDLHLHTYENNRSNIVDSTFIKNAFLGRTHIDVGSRRGKIVYEDYLSFDRDATFINRLDVHHSAKLYFNEWTYRALQIKQRSVLSKDRYRNFSDIASVPEDWRLNPGKIYYWHGSIRLATYYRLTPFNNTSSPVFTGVGPMPQSEQTIGVLRDSSISTQPPVSPPAPGRGKTPTDQSPTPTPEDTENTDSHTQPDQPVRQRAITIEEPTTTTQMPSLNKLNTQLKDGCPQQKCFRHEKY